MSPGRGNATRRAEGTQMGTGGEKEAEIDGDGNSMKAWAERVRESEIGLRSSPESAGVGKGSEKAREETGE